MGLLAAGAHALKLMALLCLPGDALSFLPAQDETSFTTPWLSLAPPTNMVREGWPRTLSGAQKPPDGSPSMIKMSVYYPADGGTRFDHDYYRTVHLPLIQNRLGDVCLHYEIDKGVAGREPGSAPAFVAACHIYADALDEFREAFAPHRPEVAADVANYTDITPIVQISEIVGDKELPARQA